MWLIEKNNITDEYFAPINLDNVKYIGQFSSNNPDKFIINFYFIDNHTVSWDFDNKAMRDSYYFNILQFLSRSK